jgi:hypothetical protein
VIPSFDLPITLVYCTLATDFSSNTGRPFADPWSTSSSAIESLASRRSCQAPTRKLEAAELLLLQTSDQIHDQAILLASIACIAKSLYMYRHQKEKYIVLLGPRGDPILRCLLFDPLASANFIASSDAAALSELGVEILPCDPSIEENFGIRHRIPTLGYIETGWHFRNTSRSFTDRFYVLDDILAIYFDVKLGNSTLHRLGFCSPRRLQTLFPGEPDFAEVPRKAQSPFPGISTTSSCYPHEVGYMGHRWWVSLPQPWMWPKQIGWRSTQVYSQTPTISFLFMVLHNPNIRSPENQLLLSHYSHFSAFHLSLVVHAIGSVDQFQNWFLGAADNFSDLLPTLQPNTFSNYVGMSSTNALNGHGHFLQPSLSRETQWEETIKSIKLRHTTEWEVSSCTLVGLHAPLSSFRIKAS